MPGERGPICPMCNKVADEWVEAEVYEALYSPKTVFCANEGCNSIFVLSPDEASAVQEQVKLYLASITPPKMNDDYGTGEET
jgi:hypothetical protein